jgi:transcriptional regulator with XRE-family HTH domain
MDTEPFGSCLRRARESRRLSLRDIAGKTKIPRSTLERIEASNIDDLPADVFVRGFIRSFARAVGADESEPLHGFERALHARRDAERALSSTPVIDPAIAAAIAGDQEGDGEGSMPRRGLGLAVFVIILLLIATITLSLLLRRPPQSGEGLSDATSAPAAGQATGPATAAA